MAANDKSAKNGPAQNGSAHNGKEAGRATPSEVASPGAAPSDAAGDAETLRIRRQTERIREMERLMRAAAAFARGRPPR